MLHVTPDYVELPVVELGPTASFYEEMFGWSFTEYGPTYASTVVDGVEIGLNTEGTVGEQQPPGAGDPTGPMLLLRTDDLAAAATQLGRVEGRVVTEPMTYPGGARLHVRDPSGNVLGIYQPDEGQA